MRIQSTLFLLTLSATTVWAQQPPAPPAVETSPPAARAPMPAPARGPSLDLALEAVQAALAFCRSQGYAVAALVNDSAGGLKVALVSDTKSGTTANFAQRKAATAMEFKMNTDEVQTLAKTDKAVADKLAANSNLFAMPGAFLMKVGDDIIGVIAAAGANATVDASCAKAGLDKVQARLK